jgi:hypothetical protein
MIEFSLSQSAFDFDVDLQSAGNPLGGDGSNSGSLLVRFAVDTPTAYSIDGLFSSAQTVGNGNAGLFVWLRNATTVFQSDQQENVAEGEGFVLGVDGSQGGDNVNTLVGSPSGVLLPGSDYFLTFSLGSGMSQTPVSGVAASGSLSLSFSSVPEPTTATLLGLGIAGLALHRRRS